jgi:hypothetical protein
MPPQNPLRREKGRELLLKEYGESDRLRGAIRLTLGMIEIAVRSTTEGMRYCNLNKGCTAKRIMKGLAGKSLNDLPTTTTDACAKVIAEVNRRVARWYRGEENQV